MTTFPSDEEQIRTLIADWHRLTALGDIKAILTLMTDDATFLRCGAPPATRREFEQGFAQWSSKARIESSADVREVSALGDYGYAVSSLRVTMIPRDGSPPATRGGYVLTVFRRQRGRWLLHRDANLFSSPGHGSGSK